MKYFYILLSMVFLMFFQANIAFAINDSTTVKPPNVAPKEKETVNVLHYAIKVSYNDEINDLSNSQNYKCPSGSTLVGMYNFFPEKTTSVNPAAYNDYYYFFSCQESYWQNNAYYMKLKANPWVECGNRYNGKPPFYCSIQIPVPPLIRFVVEIPPNSIQLNSNYTHLNFLDAQFFLGTTQSNLGSDKIYIKKSLVSTGTPSTRGIYTWAYDAGPTPIAPANYYVTWYWKLLGPTFTGGNSPRYTNSVWSTDNNNHGLYYCVIDKNGQVPFQFTITKLLFGKTCKVTCLGPWVYEPSSPNSWFSINASITCD